MDKCTHDVRRANWLNIINQCQERPANVTVHQWLKDNDIKEKSYYYWLRKFRKESYDQMKLPVTTENLAEISNDVSDAVLSRLLKEVVHAGERC